MQQFSSENQRWLKTFRTKHDRSPRVLHIGNIANNAYNNAKILNQAGLDCDVICYDYYHVMGCPEWEDADLSRSPDDDFRPDWTSLDLKGYQRPRWFAQGPMRLCIDYLVSRRSGRSDLEQQWTLLLAHSGLPFKPVNNRIVDSLWMRLSLAYRLVIARISVKCGWLYSCVLGKLRAYVPRTYSSLRFVKRFFWSVGMRRNNVGMRRNNDTQDRKNERRCEALVERFKTEFPDRPDKLSLDDLTPYIPYLDMWEKLLSHYDIIIGYSTSPVWPLLCGKPYFAIEHGTLRDIPFATDAQGRCTSLAYRFAQHCFVTNFDCVDNAAILAPERYTSINHPYDEDHGLGVTGSNELRAKLKNQLKSDFLLFHPTRHDWVSGTGYADKKNDEFLRAFGALRKRGFRVGVVLCAWGSNVLNSRQLLDELECSSYVCWTPPLAILPFERMCKACDVVVDQFKLGAFGGVVFKSMAIGTPIVTFLNEDVVARQYSEVPPVVNCMTAIEIESSLEKLIAEPGRLDELRRMSREWICSHHGKQSTIDKQLDQFRHHHPVDIHDANDVAT